MNASANFGYRILPAVLLMISYAMLISCVTDPKYSGNLRGDGLLEDRRVETEEPDAEAVSGVEGLSGTQVRLVQAARWALGRTELACNGRSFSLDCSGVVSAVYWKAGINLQEAYRLYTGNGVTRIYRYLEDEGLLYRPDAPVPGDIIFWDNSYDKNGNGAADDELTHIGMVVEVSSEGDVTYIHHDYIGGIILARMYPPEPGNTDRNSGMRIRSLGPTPDGGMTSGDLYRKAGRGWELAGD